MLQYIFQLILFQLLFLLVFELFLKKETFFSYNRIYLLLSPVLAMLLPLLKLPFLQAAIPPESLVLLPEVFIGQNVEAVTAEAQASAASEGIQALTWWFLVYAVGFLFSLGLFLRKFRFLKQLFSYQPVLHNREMRLVEVPRTKMACTFYNTIFLGSELSEKEREQILSHELVHLRQRHSLDLLFFEFLKIILWFNPLVYIYQARISACHEFLADQGVVRNLGKLDYFEQLLNSAFNTRDISFINQFFNQSLIKKRIVMLQKTKSGTASKLKFLIVLPLMLAMLVYVSCSEEPAVNPEKQEASAQQKLEEIKAIVNDGSEVTSEDYEEIKGILGSMDKQELDAALLSDKQKVEVQELKTGTSGTGDVPFVLIEKVPVFPGCESLGSNKERKACFTEKLTYFVAENFDTSLGKTLNLTGTQKIYVQFKVNAEGKVEVMGVRAIHPSLEEEAARVVNLLPQMTPGMHDGEKVGVLYSLPITFNIAE